MAGKANENSKRQLALQYAAAHSVDSMNAAMNKGKRAGSVRGKTTGKTTAKKK